MKHTSSLTKNHEFRRLYNRGKSAVSQYTVVYFRRNGKAENRLGITVSTKVGGAVERNLVRRRLKEIYRLSEDELGVGYDIVIVARVKSKFASYRELSASLISLFKKLGLMQVHAVSGQ